MRAVVATLAAAAAVVAAGCSGEARDGRATFERAQRGLARADGLRVHVSLHSLVALERTAELSAAELPLGRVHLERWVKRPRSFACGRGFACARGDLDTTAVRRDLGPDLKALPVEPSALRSARIEVRLDSRGGLRRIEVKGEYRHLDVDVDLRPTALGSSGG